MNAKVGHNIVTTSKPWSLSISSLQLIRILRWWHNVTRTEIRRRTSCKPLELMLMQRQPSSLPYPVWWAIRRHHPGGQNKRFSNNMKIIQKCCHIPPEQLEAFASDRQIWRDTCDSGLATFLAEYESAAENRRIW